MPTSPATAPRHRPRLFAAAAAPSLGLLALVLLPGMLGTATCLLFVAAGLALVFTQVTTEDRAGGSVTVLTGGYCLIAMLIAGVQAVA